MRDHPLRAIAAMLGAVAFFAGMDAVLKLFASHYEPMQVAALRGAASLPFLIAPIALRGGWRELRPVRWPLHALRGALSVLMLWGFVFSLQTLSLADVYAIFLCAPLLIAALSVPLLRERIGWRRWAAIGVGLAGVLVMLKPSGRGLLSLGALGAAASSAGYALSAITVRVLARTDSAAAIVFWAVALLTLVAGLLALPGWRPILDEHWAWLAVMGLCGAIAQHLLTEAFRSAPPGVVAPFEYTALLWGMALDWLFWDVLPSARVWLGGAIVVASGLYLIWRERITQGRSTVHSDPATT